MNASMGAELIIVGDHAQQYLIPHIRRTEILFREALRTLDPAADCVITAAADLCLPHDVIRIAGGFATGCVVDWSCSVDVIPVDTTVNIDTSSIFWLDDDPYARFDSGRFETLRAAIETDSSYEWNFHKGNHFISLVRSRKDGRSALMIHSNEKEFKYQLNGLMPVGGNWYMHDVVVFRRGSSYIRLLVGNKAAVFHKLAMDLEPYNINRHRMIATMLLDGIANIDGEYHKHHYFMPTKTTVAIGCYLCHPGEVVPVLSRLGEDIHMFKCESGGQNGITLHDGTKWLLVPHGWGKTATDPVEVVYDEMLFTINGQTFPVLPKATLGIHPGLVVREFDPDPKSPLSLFSMISTHTPGAVVDTLEQRCSYTKAGFQTHSAI